MSQYKRKKLKVEGKNRGIMTNRKKQVAENTVLTVKTLSCITHIVWVR